MRSIEFASESIEEWRQVVRDNKDPQGSVIDPYHRAIGAIRTIEYLMKIGQIESNNPAALAAIKAYQDFLSEIPQLNPRAPEIIDKYEKDMQQVGNN